MSSPDPRDPLVVDIRDLGRRAGAMLAVQRHAPAPADLGAGIAWVAQGSQVALDLRLESVVTGVLITGSATVLVSGECARCLEPISWPQTVSLSELYVYDRGEDDEQPALAGDLVELEPLLRDCVVLSLPLAPTCSPDCPGLCQQCGARLADAPGHAHDTIDPRWAALAGSETTEKDD